MGCIEQVLAWLPTVAYSSADIESNISRFPPDFAHRAPALTQIPATKDLKRTVMLLSKIGPFPFRIQLYRAYMAYNICILKMASEFLFDFEHLH